VNERYFFGVWFSATAQVATWCSEKMLTRFEREKFAWFAKDKICFGPQGKNFDWFRKVKISIDFAR
jgi:hypothetical protein